MTTGRIRILWLCFAAFLAALAVIGCSSISVQRVKARELLDSWRTSIVEADQLSARTEQTLRQVNLETAYQRTPDQAFARLQALAVQDPQPDYLFALAEMSYVFGRKAEKWNNRNAVALYYLSAGYAYHYLFDEAATSLGPGTHEETRSPAPSPTPNGFLLATDHWPLAPAFDPRFRLACDLYNAGLTKCIRAAQRIGQLDPGRELHCQRPDGSSFTLSVVQHGFAWKPDEFGSLLFCEDFQVSGLTNLYRGYGLGVPLIGTLVRTTATPAHLFYPKDVNFPVSAFFQFEGGIADLATQHSGKLELYNPLAVQTVQIKGRPIPLETDLSTPLAYFLSRTDLNGVEYEGFLSADKLTKRTGIYMLEPYQPGKIPVIMVHGLLSSPLTWAPLFNDLRADPVLRERFQFWFYLYPTANSYLVTAADLRQTLADLRAELDPHHADAALEQMVFVGHSMGGLVSRLMTTDSGDDFWGQVSSQPFATLKAAPETRDELQRVFFFQRVPSVARVIFLATPHHGSSLSPSPPGRLLAKFISLPKQLVYAARDVNVENPQLLSAFKNGNLPNSIDLLAPHAPALELLAARPRPTAVHYHSVIGVLPYSSCLLEKLLPGGSSREGTDGVVPFDSAHLEGVDSEIVVPADHFHVHHHPAAVAEVRRILLQHYAQVNAPDVIPAATTMSSETR
jgi:pimeloyl-ACP methyl ester carboxylesterase